MTSSATADSTARNHNSIDGALPEPRLALPSGSHAEFHLGDATFSTLNHRPHSEEEFSREDTFGPARGVRWTFLANIPNANVECGLELLIYDAAPWRTLCGWVRNWTAAEIDFRGLDLLVMDPAALGLGGKWQTWTALLETAGQLSTLGTLLGESDKPAKSQYVLALCDAAGAQRVLGFSLQESIGHFSLAREGDRLLLRATSDMDNVRLAPGETRFSEKLHLCEKPGVETLESYALHTGREARAKVDAPSYSGWLSWYMYNPFWDSDVTEDHVIEYLQGVETFRGDLPLQLMVLDDGYQTLPGDWTDLRPLFPHGMKWLADRVKEKGLIPGIWVAPSIVHRQSNLFKAHPDWINRKPDGSPLEIMGNWADQTYSLDVTHPEVLAYIRDLFTTITRDWGFEYVKIDFNCLPGQTRTDRGITRLIALRNMYATIREAVGPGVTIACCTGAPFGPAVGVAQFGRTSGDIIPNWSSVKNGCQHNIQRAFFHRRWWANDPDTAMFRESNSQLSVSEVQVLATTESMCGGLTNFADPLLALPEARRRMLGQIIPSIGQAARAMDLLSEPIPKLFVLSLNRPTEKFTVATVYNWGDRDAPSALDLSALGLDRHKKYHVFDFWTDRYFGLLQGRCDLGSQPPHSCRVLAIREELPGQIEVISTDLHLLQGALEITGVSRQVTAPFGCKAELTLSLQPPSLRAGKIILAAGEGLRLAACQGAKGNLVRRSDGLWDLQLSGIADRAAVLLRWR